MKPILQFVKTTLVGGVLFLLPLVLTLVLLQKALRTAADVVHPITEAVPTKSLLGVAIVDLLAIAAIVLVGFLAGLFARTPTGARLGRQVEDLVLRKMPGFTLFKSVTEQSTGFAAGAEVSVALARLDDAWLLCFIMERHANGLLTVFIPSAPTPLAGSIYYLQEDQVKRLDVSVTEATKCVMQLGVGSKAMLEGLRAAEAGRAS